jgi:hypothetical protein
MINFFFCIFPGKEWRLIIVYRMILNQIVFLSFGTWKSLRTSIVEKIRSSNYWVINMCKMDNSFYRKTSSYCGGGKIKARRFALWVFLNEIFYSYIVRCESLSEIRHVQFDIFFLLWRVDLPQNIIVVDITMLIIHIYHYETKVPSPTQQLILYYF